MNQVLKKIERLNEIGIALSAASNVKVLCDEILTGAMELTNCDAGSLYRMSDDKTELEFVIVRNNSLGTHMGGSGGVEMTFPPVPLMVDGKPNKNNVVSSAVHDDVTIKIPDAYHAEGFDFSGTRKFDQETGYRTQSILTIALKNHHNEIIGALQLINAKDEQSGETRDFTPADQQLAESLASQAAITITNNRLIEEQRELLLGFVDMMVEALSDKSLYTGGHCKRVPVITEMLAQAAVDSSEGKFRGFTLNSNEWEELKMAGKLHDCGKVATPEYVVDKSTKLETIYDRIHEVRMRFEVLKRDAEIDCWKKIAAGADENEQREILDRYCRQIDDDFAFVAECNIGGEFMSDEQVERLNMIAQKSWQRTLDDRLGISWEEASRKSVNNQQPPAQCSLPVAEKLLADKAEHLILRDKKETELVEKITRKDNEWGFNIKVPKFRSNRGELYNLCVKRGTLTEEDRYTINEHMVYTIIMLENLPFKNDLRNVPFIAASHHETMDGNGYPKKLKMSELQPDRTWKNMQTAKMMVIADIFEALTASDRPYKKPKTLSESLRILSFMRNDNHIDPDLFELFLTSGVYKQYAKEAPLLQEQIDEVDINDYL